MALMESDIIENETGWQNLTFTRSASISHPLLKSAKEVVVTLRDFATEILILPTILNNPTSSWAGGTEGYFNEMIYTAQINNSIYHARAVYQWNRVNGTLKTFKVHATYSSWTDAIFYPEAISVKL